MKTEKQYKDLTIREFTKAADVYESGHSGIYEMCKEDYGKCGNLDLLFVSPHVHSKGIGYAAWCAVERLHPEVTVWKTVTPYFEKRNIHFYVNRCGFHIVEFFNSHHPDPNDPDADHEMDDQFPDGMFRFEKRMPGCQETDIG